ncbi:Chromosome 5 4 [Actinomortierella ambigua]|uniref:Chromosome 5 4 n=1 Tax=Actinomortierella ambigua TaxID=1343610 RepID=A0A9P6PYL1_9FUNG|nr:Chromosome 5 4 [Actinomortierella ambigua]
MGKELAKQKMEDADEQVPVQDEWGPTISHNKALFEFGDVFFYTVMLTLIFGSLHVYGERVWEHIVTTYSKEAVFFGGSFIVSMGGFWFWVSLTAVLDLYQFPKSFWRYKIQPQKVPDWSWYRKALSNVLMNQFFVNIPVGYGLYHLMQWRGNSMGMDLPTILDLARDSIGFLIVEELGFYYGHRLLHHPKIYKYIHKKHHEFTAPIGIAAIYAHPVEHFIANVAPLVLGPVLMKSHVITLWIWITIGQTNAINSHCGFHLPLFPSPLAHDYHHEVFHVNFGPVGVLDWLHGTGGSREKTAEKKRLREQQAAEKKRQQLAEQGKADKVN